VSRLAVRISSFRMFVVAPRDVTSTPEEARTLALGGRERGRRRRDALEQEAPHPVIRERLADDLDPRGVARAGLDARSGGDVERSAQELVQGDERGGRTPGAVRVGERELELALDARDVAEEVERTERRQGPGRGVEPRLVRALELTVVDQLGRCRHRLGDLRRVVGGAGGAARRRERLARVPAAAGGQASGEQESQ
jgi:hypothetical protein